MNEENELERAARKLENLNERKLMIAERIQRQRPIVIKQIVALRKKRKISICDMECITENNKANISRMENKNEASNDLIIRAATGLLWVLRSNQQKKKNGKRK